MSARIVSVPAGRMAEYRPEHPDRTAYRSGTGALDFDIYLRVWPSRGAMLTAIEMQGRSDSHLPKWHDYFTSRWNNGGAK